MNLVDAVQREDLAVNEDVSPLPPWGRDVFLDPARILVEPELERIAGTPERVLDVILTW